MNRDVPAEILDIIVSHKDARDATDAICDLMRAVVRDLFISHDRNVSEVLLAEVFPPGSPTSPRKP